MAAASHHLFIIAAVYTLHCATPLEHTLIDKCTLNVTDSSKEKILNLPQLPKTSWIVLIMDNDVTH